MGKKSLITNEMINLVKSSIAEIEIEKVSFDEYRAFSVGRVTLTKEPGEKVYMYLDETFDNEYKSLWKADVGEVLRKEMRKESPELYILKDSKFKALVKKIGDDEMDSFKENWFVHFKIGDNSYTIIRIIKPFHVFSYKDRSNDYAIEEKFESYIIEDDEDKKIKEEDLKSTELF